MATKLHESEVINKRTCWRKVTDIDQLNFPKFTHQDLVLFSLGTYQIKIANRYIEQHLDVTKKFEIFQNVNQPNIIRAKIASRFSRTRKHQVWLEYINDCNPSKAILGYYCQCKVGARTVGCCSHIMSIVRYLGYDRYKEKTTSSRKMDRLILNAAELIVLKMKTKKAIKDSILL